MRWRRLRTKHRWFAWYPVFCRKADCWVWLEPVWRTFTYGRDGRLPEYQPDEVLR